MSLNRYAKKQDANAKHLIEVFQAQGCTVEAVTGSKGTPDLLVGGWGITELVEVKPAVGLKARSQLRVSQELWWSRWRGRKPVLVRTVADCLDLVARMRAAATSSEVAS